MSQTQSEIRKTWVAYGPNGVTASIHETDAGFTVNSLGRESFGGTFENLEVAKRAVTSRIGGEVSFEPH